MPARPDAVDESDARRVPGVQDIVQTTSGIAVIADSTYAAFMGREALRIDWTTESENPISSQQIKSRLHHELDNGEPRIAREDGNALNALQTAGVTVTAVYEVPYLAHTAMEPMNCVAHVHDGMCEVWAPTQAPNLARHAASSAAGVPLDKVYVYTPYLGGGFGRKTASQFVSDAAELAAGLEGPVQVVWTREDDLQQAEYRDASVHRLQASLDSKGQPRAWLHRISSSIAEPPAGSAVSDAAAMGARDNPYAIEHLRVEWVPAQIPVPTTIWRSVGFSYNTFAIESFIDEMAQKAGQDPLAYRRKLLGLHPRMVGCLDRVREMSDWIEARRQNRALGVAVCSAFGSHVAQVAQVIEVPDGDFRVTKIWCAVDCGIAINPDTVAAQLEGAITYGLSAALFEQVTVQDGAIAESNFDTYPIARYADVPDIEVEIIPSIDPPGGIGELGVPPIAPAIANALFAASGRRIRSLPLKESYAAAPGDPSRS